MKKIRKIPWIIFSTIIVLLALIPVFLNSETEILDAKTRAGAPGSFVELPQGICHFQKAGPDTARTVVLVHGFSSPYYIWDPTFKALVENGFRVIRFDLFGRGYSDRPDGTYNKEFYTRQINELLLALNLRETIDIIGLSMGGPIATEFTVAYPEKVKKVILIDPVHEAADISVLKTPLIGEYLMNVYFGPSLSKSQLDVFYRPAGFTDLQEKFSIQLKFKGYKKALLSTLRFYMNEDKLPVYQKLEQLQKPVMLIWGEEDIKVPYFGNERIREILDCKFLSVTEAGHLPHYERPVIVNKGIIDFLND